MSVAAHLRVTPSGYDRRIRALLPHYDELIAEAARALPHASRPIGLIVDLGIGTGALTRACLAHAPRARVWGIDEDADMMAMAQARLRSPRRSVSGGGARVTLVPGSFLEVPLPRCDAIVASYALHHIRSRRAKASFYRRCRRALRPGGVFISGDCFPSSTKAGAAEELNRWLAHLTKATGSRARARRIYDSWADEDTYVPLADEIELLTRAGFRVDVPWRRAPFAVVVGTR